MLNKQCITIDWKIIECTGEEINHIMLADYYGISNAVFDTFVAKKIKEQEENNKQEDELTPFEKNLEIYQALQSFL